MRPGVRLLLSALPTLLAAGAAFSDEARPQTPEYQEVYDLIRQHLAGINETELNRTAVQALVSALSPRVSLVSQTGTLVDDHGFISRSNLFDGPVAYIRIQRVEEGLGPALRQAYEKLHGATNKLKGVVLDLRYASGSGYAAAVGAASLFVSKEQPLLDWGQGMVQSRPEGEPVSLPAAVLVNRQTAGAAEALAAVLREAGVGLILGNRTAGQAMMTEDFPLKSGDRLRIATAPVKLGDGSSLSTEGLKPDIVVEVGVQDERAYFADAFREPQPTNLVSALRAPGGTNQVAGTNRTRRVRFNEAELVREKREGFNPELEFSPDGEPVGHGRGPGLGAESERPVVHDPVLARALDLLKGLAVVRASRS